MSGTTQPGVAPAEPAQADGTFVAPTFWSLLRAEVLRVRSRRFVAWSALVLLALMLLVVIVQFNATTSYSGAEVERALATCTQQGGAGMGESTAGDSSDGSCTVADAVAMGTFPGDPPAYRGEVADWVMFVGVAAAAFAFILGATFGGADWANKTMPALLFWEPRRARVYAAKLLALAVGITAFFLLAQVVWLLLCLPVYALHGVWDDGTGSLLEPVLTNLARTWLLAAVFGSIAFGIASLTRNTGAALGAGFVYFALFETFAGALLSWIQEWVLLINIAAVLTPGGLEESNGDGTDLIVISSERGALVLVTYALVINLVAYVLFRRRDIT